VMLKLCKVTEKCVFSRTSSERERRCAKWVHYPTYVFKTAPHTHTHKHTHTHEHARTRTHKHWSVNMYQGRNTANTELQITGEHHGNNKKFAKRNMAIG